jgi:hypothetical protein
MLAHRAAHPVVVRLAAFRKFGSYVTPLCC